MRHSLDADSDLFEIQPHHPDRLRRPVPRAAAARADVMAHAMTWNIFRALELLPPAFWLRRFHARLQNAENLGPAPVTLGISLWRTLPPSPAYAIRSESPAVLADVVIETEHVVWTLITTFGADIAGADDDPAGLDPIGRLIDAGCWFAGRREYYCGLIVRNPSECARGVSLIQRYAARPAAITRVPASGASRGGVRGVGIARWDDLVEILEDCASSPVLTDFDRAVARRALAWVGGV